jgi:ribosomal-protein-serine acetyltransferase
MHVPSLTELSSRPVRTHRLALAPLDAHDARDFFRAVEASRAHLARELPWVETCAEMSAAVALCDGATRDWERTRALRFAVRDRTTLQLLGAVTLEGLVTAHANADLTFWVRADSLRRGVATEAAAAVVDFAFHRMGMHRLRATAATTNIAALGVLARLGFRLEGIVREGERSGGRWVDAATFGLLAR